VRSNKHKKKLSYNKLNKLSKQINPEPKEDDDAATTDYSNHYYIKLDMKTKFQLFIAVAFDKFGCIFKSERIKKLKKMYAKGEQKLKHDMCVSEIVSDIKSI
jgi:hypothetical protein